MSTTDLSMSASPELPTRGLDDRRRAQHQARALDGWREAELQVHERWEAFLVADRKSRRFAFAAYTTALDAEAAAADVLARTHLDLAAAA